MTYDIRTKTHLLEKSRGGKYGCPSCGIPNLHIQHRTGAYTCFGNGCTAANIREAIDMLEGKDPWVPEPVWVKPPRGACKTIYEYPDRAGKALARVERVDHGDGAKKDFYQSSIDANGIWVKKMPDEMRKHIPIYNYSAVRAAAGKQKIWVVEGEATAAALIALGLPATTTIGGSSGFARYGDYQHDLRECQLILCPDRDSKGVAYMAEWAAMFEAQVTDYFLCGTHGLWHGLADAQGGDGMDIHDHVSDHRILDPGKLSEWLVDPAKYRSIIRGATHDSGQAQALQKASSILTETEHSQLLELIALRGVSPDTQTYPEGLQGMMDRDALRHGIDPLAYTCYLLPAVASLMHCTTLTLAGGFKVPNIIWSVLIQRSGGGKSRAEGLIKHQLFKWEEEGYRSWRQKYDAHKQLIASAKKESRSTNFGGGPIDLPPAPIRKQYLLEVATPQAVARVLASNDGQAIAWFRDEIKGLFSSLGQFTQSEGEGMEILLQYWDGNGSIVNRVNPEDSFLASSSRLSLAGGIQPAILAKVFSENDPQGMFARFLPIIPHEVEPKLFEGDLELAKELPSLYSWVKAQDWGDLILSPSAREAFGAMYEALRDTPAPNESSRAWLAKAAGQVGRVAIALHAIDCYYKGAGPSGIVGEDVLLAAYGLVLRCYDDVCRCAGVLADNDQQSSMAICSNKILLWLQKHRDGQTMPDLYRNIRTIKTMAKLEGVSVSSFTHQLCRDLESKGLVRLETAPRGSSVAFLVG